ncbi:40S ribosomal protein S15a-4 [Linum perenne]
MIRPSSKVIIKFLIVTQKHGYIGEFEYVDDHSAVWFFVLTTSAGIMDHEEARRKNVGGKVPAYQIVSNDRS